MNLNIALGSSLIQLYLCKNSYLESACISHCIELLNHKNYLVVYMYVYVIDCDVIIDIQFFLQSVSGVTVNIDTRDTSQ